jgi:hypothetical protein
MRRLIAITAVCAVSIGATAEAATLSLAPTSGPTGTVVNASGSGFPKLKMTTLRMCRQVVRNSFKTTSKGKFFNKTFAVPSACAADTRRVTATTATGVTASASFNVTAPPPADRDRDGVPDSSDQCPDVAGPAPSGCPPATGYTTVPPDGGAGYYGRFASPLSSGPGYFPIGVWGAYDQTQANMDKDAAVGINTYVWAADSNFMDDIRADGRFHVIQDEGSRTNVGSETAGWLLGDEIDMTRGPGACPGAIDSIKAGLPADGRLRYANYGKGVLIWGATGYNGHNDTSSACFVNRQDLTSADLYWFTDPYETNHPQSGTAWGYGWSVERMRMLDAKDGKRQPIWNFVEVGCPFSNGGCITPAQIRAAVWHSIIAGARGIIYFNHSFGGPCPTHHVLRSSCGDYPAVQAEVAKTNALVEKLAPVLNSPTVTSGFEHSPTVRATAKLTGDTFHVIAGSAENAVSQATFELPVGDTVATVVGEDRTLSVTAGAFSDSFANGNSVHAYRIDSGSTFGSPVSSEFSFGKTKRNLKKGWARLAVRVPGPGELRLKKTRRVRRASNPAAEAGTVGLQIRPRGKARRKLKTAGHRNRTLRARVTAKVTYTPSGGQPNTESRNVRLKRRNSGG